MEKKRENGLWQSSTFFWPRAAPRRLRFAPCCVALRAERTNERTTHTLWTKGWHTMLERGLGPILPIRVSMPFNFIMAKAREGSWAARLARMWSRNLAPYGPGTCVLQRGWGFLRCTFGENVAQESGPGTCVLQRGWGFLRCTFGEDVALEFRIGRALSGRNLQTRAPKTKIKISRFFFHRRLPTFHNHFKWNGSCKVVEV